MIERRREREGRRRDIEREGEIREIGERDRESKRRAEKNPREISRTGK